MSCAIERNFAGVEQRTIGKGRRRRSFNEPELGCVLVKLLQSLFFFFHLHDEKVAMCSSWGISVTFGNYWVISLHKNVTSLASLCNIILDTVYFIGLIITAVDECLPCCVCTDFRNCYIGLREREIWKLNDPLKRVIPFIYKLKK